MAAADSPIVLTTENQRRLQRALRKRHATLPQGFRMAGNAGATSGSGGMQKTIALITGNLLEAQEAEKHGLWRFEALLSTGWTLHENAGDQDYGTCAICFEGPIAEAALPCGHAFGCADCSAFLVGQPCPICRVPIASLGEVPEGTTKIVAGVSLPREAWVIFRAPSAGSKRGRAWKAGLRDDIVLLDENEMAVEAARLLEGGESSFTALTDYAAASPSLFWSAVHHCALTSVDTDAAVFAFLSSLQKSKKAKKE